MMLDLNCFAGRDCPTKSAQAHALSSDIERVCQVTLGTATWISGPHSNRQDRFRSFSVTFALS